MKRVTALRYCIEIARRVRAVEGVIPTPFGDHQGIRVKRMWIFGSTAKGSALPNDLDLLVDYENHGSRQAWQDVGVDLAYQRRYGMDRAKPSIDEALKWLTKGMRKVSRHTTALECAKIDVKKMIYPQYRMPST